MLKSSDNKVWYYYIEFFTVGTHTRITINKYT